MLKFSSANAKTYKLAQHFHVPINSIYSIDLLSGWSCPGAKDCLAKVYISNNGTKYLKDGPHTQFRCFSASQEALYPSVYNLRRHNRNQIRKCDNWYDIACLLYNSIPDNAKIIRYHVGGDFMSESHMRAAIHLSKWCPNILFYGYTKSLHFLWALRKRCIDLSQGIIRPNFLITASLGGRYDSYVDRLNVRTARVIFSKRQAKRLPIDHADISAASPGGDFCLLLHGIQPANSLAGKALVSLNGQGSYNRKVKV